MLRVCAVVVVVYYFCPKAVTKKLFNNITDFTYESHLTH